MRKLLLATLGKGIFFLFVTLEKLNARFSFVGDHTFFDLDAFGWVPEVEKHAAAIQHELAHLMDRENVPNFQDISPEQALLTTDDRWKVFFFYAYGGKIERNCQQCPNTTAVLHQIPGLKTAMFSILSLQKHLPPHRGPYNGVLRYHLGLKVPGDGTQCGIRVGDDVRYWQEGASLIFDDSYDHEAWNRTDETRVVLFVDFVRPLPWPLHLLNLWVIHRMRHSSGVLTILKNAEQWDRELDETAPSERS